MFHIIIGYRFSARIAAESLCGGNILPTPLFLFVDVFLTHSINVSKSDTTLFPPPSCSVAPQGSWTVV